MKFTQTISGTTYEFDGIVELMAKRPIAIRGSTRRVRRHLRRRTGICRMAVADVPLATFLEELVVPYETDEVTRLIIDTTTVRHSRRYRI